MKTQKKRELTEEDYLKNSVKTQNNGSKNKVNTTIETPGINNSGIEAKRNGW